MTLVPLDAAGPSSWVVIFASLRSDSDPDEYAAMAERMLSLATDQPGFLGEDSARGADGLGLTISYWSSREAMDAWRRQAEHREAQRLGRERFYARYTLRVAQVLEARDHGA